jgi:DNA-binding MurR/RpiR family transcriptional regulator
MTETNLHPPGTRLVEHEGDLRDLIQRHAGVLPPQQRLLADFLLEHLQSVPFLSVPEMARRAQVSEATVVRFAQRIGYRGFSELKMDLVEMLRDRLSHPEDELPHRAEDDVVGTVSDLEISNIRRTMEEIDRPAFADAAEAIFSAEHVYTFGMGISAHLAEIAAYTFVQIGLRTTHLSTRFSAPREQLVVVRPGDLLLVLSFPPYSKQTLAMIEDARGIDAVTVAVTDRITAPAAALAHHVLPVRSDNTMFTNAIAAVTVLFNALATEIATRHRAEALGALHRINRMLKDEGELLPPQR